MNRKEMIRFSIGGILLLVFVFVGWQVFVAPEKVEAITETEAQAIVVDRFEGEIRQTQLKDGVYTVSVKSSKGEYDISISKANGEVIDVKQTRDHIAVHNLSEKVIRQMIHDAIPGKITTLSKETKDKVHYYTAIVVQDQEEIEVLVQGETGEVIKQKKLQPKVAQQEKQNETPNTSRKPAKKHPSTHNEGNANKNQNAETKPKQETPARNISEQEAIRIALRQVSGEVDDVDFETENGQSYYFIEIETKDDQEAEIQIHAITGKVISIEWDD